MKGSSSDGGPKRSVLSSAFRSPLFWALVVGAVIVACLLLAPSLGDRYTVF